MDFDAKKYDTGANDADKPARQLICLAREFLGPTRSKSSSITILDLGCGPGNTAQMLQENFPLAKIFGIDIDPEMIRYANENVKNDNCKFFEQNLEKPLEEWPEEIRKLTGKIDIIFSNYAMHWIDNVEIFCDSIKKLLKTNDETGGGLFVGNLLYCGWLQPYATSDREKFLLNGVLRYPTEESFVSKFFWALKRHQYPWMNAEYREPISKFPKKFYTESFIQIPIKWYRKFLDEKISLSESESKELDEILKCLILKQRTVPTTEPDSKDIEIRQQLWIFQASTKSLEF